MNGQSKTKQAFQSVSRWFLLISVILVGVIFTILQPKFLNIGNLMDILRTTSVIGILGIGQMFANSVGEINFSLGSQLTVSAGIVGYIMAAAEPGFYPLAILAAFVALIISGIIVGIFVIDIGVPSFIATLAMQTLLYGVAKLLMGNSSLYSTNWGDYYTFLGQGYLFGIVPITVIVFLIIAVLTHIYYSKTRIGRYLFAVGANPVASKQVGVNVRKVKYLAFGLSSLFGAIAGVLMTSILKSTTITMGNELLLPAISVPILGATFLTPGKFNIPGTVVAALLLTMIQNGVISAGGSFFVKDIIQGVILMISVGIIAMIREEGLPKVKFGT